MTLDFTKMNGAGNDFVLLDGRSHNPRLTREQVICLCDRHRGVGADGVMVMVPSASGKADWAWEFFNSDGSDATMCGNGARCFARYVRQLTGTDRALTFETGAGVITASFRGELVTIGLTAPGDWRLHLSVPLRSGAVTLHSVNTGVPHAVLFVPDADQAMVTEVGSEVRHHAVFAPKGTNVNFVQVLGPDAIRVRTFERGVEGETLACGTGVTASALVSARVHAFRSPVRVLVQGGDTLEVGFVQRGEEFVDVTLTGPADFAFEGRIEL
jgi:diaminopimelate epimerase